MDDELVATLPRVVQSQPTVIYLLLQFTSGLYFALSSFDWCTLCTGSVEQNFFILCSQYLPITCTGCYFVLENFSLAGSLQCKVYTGLLCGEQHLSLQVLHFTVGLKLQKLFLHFKVVWCTYIHLIECTRNSFMFCL